MIKYVLFDLDGTLTDPAEGIVKAIKYSLEKLSFSKYDEKILSMFIGAPLVLAYEKYFGFSEEKARNAVSLYRKYYNTTGVFENYVYEGIHQLLSKLNNDGYITMIATLKPTKTARRVLEHFDLAKYFSFVIGSDPNKTNEEKTDIIAAAIKTTGETDRSKIVMVGDRMHDMLGAKQNNIDSIGVLYGYGSREELAEAGAKHIAENADEIYRIIKNK